MTKLTDFRVVREHEGDRFYAVDDVRTADAAEVQHLVPHVLEPMAKAKRAPKNKAEPSAPENKAITTPRRRKGTTPATGQ